MYCKYCGEIIDDDSRFCSSCGQKIVAEFVDQGANNLVTNSIVEKVEKDQKQKTVNVNVSLGKPKFIEKNKELKAEIRPQSKFDESYEKDYGPTIFSFVLLILSFTIGALAYTDDGPIVYAVSVLVLFSIRIAVTIWCANIALKLNRDQFGWGIFGFILPILALFIIGTLRKIKKETV